MADHSLQGATYALKTIQLAKMDVNIERKWQIDKLGDLSVTGLMQLHYRSVIN